MSADAAARLPRRVGVVFVIVIVIPSSLRRARVRRRPLVREEHHLPPEAVLHLIRDG
ncbi:hypothetical protein GCM10009750_02130 [Agromyces salentinus]|uniref:Uncharacterized protein n=1 Tax=Agromyces salentinus TaxID=269421 RepID=A0ABP4YSQ7_9MICO